MQDKVYSFVKSKIYGVSQSTKVLDIGSMDINGSLRDLFGDYTGLDMREGKNVDVVSNSHDIPFPDNHFDIVTCVEMLEHDDNPFQTMSEIHRVLKPKGLVIIAAPFSVVKHDHPWDYFRYTDEGLKVLLRGFKDVETSQDKDESYGVGFKNE